MKVHVLELREAENYIPNRLLQAKKPYREASQRLKFFKKLTKEQRGHFDMKLGFGKSGEVPENQKSLFDGLPDKVVSGLKQGFGADVIKLFQDVAAHRITEADFDRDLGSDAATELRSILTLLRQIV
ncbi:hypothetical protein DQ384_11790 [Sphaerisporangium album]|uniref:Uncharacterized protein n=1 Tax=Sphaerisporangium album TaxID=509200 RepID=A0A367FNG4_9ACTN|nr:hypothetical protein DQ384_11790 [Sphaerisporangium album]